MTIFANSAPKIGYHGDVPSLERSENEDRVVHHLQSHFTNRENLVKIGPVNSCIIWLQGGPLKVKEKKQRQNI